MLRCEACGSPRATVYWLSLTKGQTLQLCKRCAMVHNYNLLLPILFAAMVVIGIGFWISVEFR
jgi:hypothetical protein